MKLLTFQDVKNQQSVYGLLWKDQVVHLPEAFKILGIQPPGSMEEFILRGEEALLPAASLLKEGDSPSWLQDVSYPLEQLKLLSPITRPSKIICIGLNYLEHAHETGIPIPNEPILFGKYPNALIGSGEPVRLPHLSSKVDFEAELAVIIGKKVYRMEKGMRWKQSLVIRISTILAPGICNGKTDSG